MAAPNNRTNLKIMALMLCLILSVTSSADYQFSNKFFGGPNQQVSKISGNLQGLVASKSGLPVEYLNDAGELECHILFRVVDGQWESLGDIGTSGGFCPLLNGATPIRTVEAFGTDICIGGDFTNLGGISGLSYFACYSEFLGWYQPNGIGNGPNNSVYSIDVDGPTMFLGGVFTTVNGGAMSAKRVVKTDGLSWEPLYTDASQTDNGVGSPVQKVLSTTSFLVALSGNSTLTWNSAVPEWVNRGGHNGSAVGDPDVVINGSVLTVGTKNATSVAGDSGGSVSDFSFGDDAWSEFGMSAGIDTQFAQLAYGLGPLYSTGDFTSFDANARGLAWYQVNTWVAAPMHQQLGDLNNFRVLDMQQAGNEFCLLTQGSPPDAELSWQSSVCYDGVTWQGDNQAPISNVVQTMGEYQGEVIHGGDFLVAGDQKSPYIAALDDQQNWLGISQLTWSGGGQGHVSQVQTYAGDLYASGIFDGADGVSVSGIAKYDGTNWVPVITGLSAFNGLMTVWDNKLIINGTYNGNLGPVLAWDGNSISEVGNFIQNGVFTDFTVYQGDLVASNVASGTSRLYAFDGNAWQSFAGTAQGVYNTLEVVGNRLYVGGVFTGACNGVNFISANNIFVWDGMGCDALGTGVTNTTSFIGINDIQGYGAGVVVTGRFDQAGGIPANSLAMWNGANWSAFDQGLVDGEDEGTGNALWLQGNTLYIAGYFEQAGNALSHNFASLDLDPIFSNGFD
ncbi:hypothetical protein OS175_04440 [Marinicella sp. S1101]|uniref:hypothetical protein n=1 Tax=Marinicella marina TaxID=2996016 RepID=UPI002260E923|nr:hypothetical protein [Marinicella marina]MCX7553116.1 hypothetical protein [Marinicella marina]MDJ1138848.1 hypothetical protein [Marinicella marina]